jgi:DNA-binding GntR family transcriptional regulator
MAASAELSAGRPGPARHEGGPLRRASLHEELLAHLRERILEGALRPGERVDEAQLCTELGVSRTPVREALKVLASEGLVALKPHRGAVVTEVTSSDVCAVFEVMAWLDRLVGLHAVQRGSEEDLEALHRAHLQMLVHHREGQRQEYFELNQRIHLGLVACAGNPILLGIYGDCLRKISRARYLANLTQARWDESAREHEAIMAALAAGDGERLGVLLAEHTQATASVVIRAVEEMAADGAAPPDART